MKDYQRETIETCGRGDVREDFGTLDEKSRLGVIPHLREELTHTRLALTAQRRTNRELRQTIRILGARVRLLERLLGHQAADVAILMACNEVPEEAIGWRGCTPGAVWEPVRQAIALKRSIPYTIERAREMGLIP